MQPRSESLTRGSKPWFKTQRDINLGRITKFQSKKARWRYPYNRERDSVERNALADGGGSSGKVALPIAETNHCDRRTRWGVVGTRDASS